MSTHNPFWVTFEGRKPACVGVDWRDGPDAPTDSKKGPGPMRVQHMEDMARLYAPAAARSIRNRDWDQAAALLLERCQKLDMALQSLTPGGSEYVGDPDRCVAHARGLIQKGQQALLDLALLRNKTKTI